ncbi:MAG: thioredoxin, partial [Dongiaceae bacterium]
MEQLIGMGGGQEPAGGAVIRESNTEGFMADVIDASQDAPVIVDFWAPWCGPCKQLTPILEKVVRDARGAVRLVKINTDENQELAAQMRVQSIPSVFGFVKGRPVGAFSGAQPESQVKAFVQRLVQAAGGQVGPSPVEQALAQAEEALARGDAGTASAIFAQVMAHDPTSAAAIAGLARCHIDAGNHAEAKKVLERAAGELANNPAIAAARAALELAEQSAQSASQTTEFRQRLEQNPNDHQARLDLAMALYGAGQRDAAIDELLESIRRDRRWNDDAARKQLVKLFEALGPTDPLTISGRRR